LIASHPSEGCLPDRRALYHADTSTMKSRVLLTLVIGLLSLMIFTPWFYFTDLVQTVPYPDLGFVYGVPLNPGAMARANIGAAAHVFVFANHRFGDPDLKTFHAAKRIHNIAPNATIWVEAMDPQSDLAAQLAPEIRLMPSRLMMEQVLRPEGINLRQWLKASEETRKG